MIHGRRWPRADSRHTREAPPVPLSASARTPEEVLRFPTVPFGVGNDSSATLSTVGLPRRLASLFHGVAVEASSRTRRSPIAWLTTAEFQVRLRLFQPIKRNATAVHELRDHRSNSYTVAASGACPTAPSAPNGRRLCQFRIPDNGRRTLMRHAGWLSFKGALNLLLRHGS